MPTKKEQTVERSQKVKPAAKKTSTKAAKAALDLPCLPETGDSASADTATPASTKVVSKKPAKKPAKKQAPEDSVSAASAPNAQISEHSKAPAPAVPESQEHFQEPSVTEENISVRAYFIGEHRRAYGIPGSSEEDWLEAERQLQAEAVASRAFHRSGLQN